MLIIDIQLISLMQIYLSFDISISRLNQNFEIYNMYFNSGYEQISHWFSLIPLGKCIILFLYILPIFFLKNKLIKASVYSFFSLMGLFIIFTDYNISVRYTYTLLFIFYIIGIASSLYLLLNKKWSKSLSWLIILIIIFAFNPINTTMMINDSKTGVYSNLNGVFYSDAFPIIEMLKENQLNNTTIITTHPKLFIFYFDYKFIPRDDNASFYEVFPIKTQINSYDFVYNIYTSRNYRNFDSIKNIISNNTKGLIILEKYFYKREDVSINPILKKNRDFQINNKTIYYIGLIGSFHVYKWGS